MTNVEKRKRRSSADFCSPISCHNARCKATTENVSLSSVGSRKIYCPVLNQTSKQGIPVPASSATDHGATLTLKLKQLQQKVYRVEQKE